ncbi:hypothetical protein LCGC14_1041220 [marine sediment metagenome]|uniref:Uncharacterized protein n=1 Tax=marine sediment metagenome TaxID=412755 RepID=A0A0F9MW47_9ZZZZ
MSVTVDFVGVSARKINGEIKAILLDTEFIGESRSAREGIEPLVEDKLVVRLDSDEINVDENIRQYLVLDKHAFLSAIEADLTILDPDYRRFEGLTSYTEGHETIIEMMTKYQDDPHVQWYFHIT